MLKPKYTPISQFHTNQNTTDVLPKCFTVLAWNLHKIDFIHFTHRSINELLKQSILSHEPHILSLQEANTLPYQTSFFNQSFVMAPNIQTKENHYGVLTASSTIIKPLQQCLTHSREFGWATHKTALITQHKLDNQEILTHINIHSVIFVSHSVFQRELAKLLHHLDHITGPVIISGDFNTWNKKRTKTLTQATHKFGLEKVSYSDPRAIKSILKQPLDHIFFRGLTLQSSMVLDITHISDHNPILATFCTNANP